MRKNFPDEDATGPVVDSRDEPILVSFHVEHCVTFHGIGSRKRLANFRQAIPLRFFGDAEPGIEWTFQISMYRRRFAQPLSRDHMHPSGPGIVSSPSSAQSLNTRSILGGVLPAQHLTTPIRFSFCEPVKRGFAECELPSYRRSCADGAAVGSSSPLAARGHSTKARRRGKMRCVKGGIEGTARWKRPLLEQGVSGEWR